MRTSADWQDHFLGESDRYESETTIMRGIIAESIMTRIIDGVARRLLFAGEKESW